MTRQEKNRINFEIKRLKDRKDYIIDEFIGRAKEINNEIKYYESLLKADK